MRVLLTGSEGYIGVVLRRRLVEAGHSVVGLDSHLYRGCTFGPDPEPIPTLDRDVRDVEVEDLAGFQAVIHLAALSNDPVGDLDPEVTRDVNWRATTALAEKARTAGVQRFLFSSSCSLYGASTTATEALTEESPFNPVTAYGESKILAEHDLWQLATRDFSPTFLRNATAYGVSPMLRLDLVVNNLVGHAVTSGAIVLQSDGSPWRPLVHVEDIARAFVAVLEAPLDLVHNQAFNVGRSTENLQVRTIAELVVAAVPGSTVELAPGAGPDQRDYRVDFTKIEQTLPSFRPVWTVADGIQELIEAYRREGFDRSAFESDRYIRIRHLRTRLDHEQLDATLRPCGVGRP
jgi:nucleoside-diphosphate-sugar epimerase